MKPETTKKLLALKNYLGACDNLQPDQKAKFAKMIEEVFYAESPVIKGGKFDIYKFTTPVIWSDILAGVYYDNGQIVATNGHMWAAIKSDYPSEREGLVIDKNGKEIKGKYPNVKNVIPSTEGWSEHQIDFAKVCEIIQRSKAWAKANGKKRQSVDVERLVKVGPAFFLLDYFEKIVSGMEYIGENVLFIKDKISGAVCKNDKGALFLTSCLEPSDEDEVFIEELK